MILVFSLLVLDLVFYVISRFAVYCIFIFWLFSVEILGVDLGQCPCTLSYWSILVI